MFAVLGSTTVDVVVESPRGLPQPDGEEFTSSSLVFCDVPIRFSPGGNACNCAYVLAGLGAETLLCSAVGGDELGEMMLGWLEDRGVGLRALKQRPEESTSSTTIISAGETRLSFHHSGALSSYGTEDLSDYHLEAAHTLLVCAYPLLARWRPDGYGDLLREARSRGLTTALDVGPAVGKPVTLDELADILPNVDYFICNSLELQKCTGVDELEGGMQRAAQAGASCIITKLGPRGAALLAPGADRPEFVPAFEVENRGTVGAGDSFNAGFLYALRDGFEPLEAVRFGSALASLVIESPRGVMAAPTVDEVRRILAS